jgi:NADH:ubiquinone oxidoreductase subunit
MAKLLQNIKIWTGFDKFENLAKIIRHNGGLKKSIKKMYLQDDLKIGTLIGEDEFGNKYYENPYYFVPRNRWVEFNEKRGLDYNASQIPPEWHRWMTHMTEYPPTIEKPVSYPWMLKYQENMTGTPEAYMPHSTVKPKIQAWTPKSTYPQIESKSMNR